MPVKHGKDKKGPYFKFGVGGTKYYYKPDSTRSAAIAKGKALKQGAAMHLSKDESK